MEFILRIKENLCQQIFLRSPFNLVANVVIAISFPLVGFMQNVSSVSLIAMSGSEKPQRYFVI